VLPASNRDLGLGWPTIGTSERDSETISDAVIGFATAELSAIGETGGDIVVDGEVQPRLNHTPIPGVRLDGQYPN
jgi:hypothetical protein